jgi:hypothetical protein
MFQPEDKSTMTQLHTLSQLSAIERSHCYSSAAPTPLYGTARKPKATGVSKPNHSAESLNGGSRQGLR